MAGKVWTSEEIDFIKVNYVSMSPKEIAEKLGRTRKAVWSRMNLLGLSKPDPKIGDTFGKLTIKEIFVEFTGRQNKTMVICDCDCGTKDCKTILSQITNDYKSSCGCLSGCHNKDEFIKSGKNFAHGLRNHRLYSIWIGMKNRCLNKNTDQYKDYGGRGILICEEWLDFRKFYSWAIENGYDDEFTLDREENDKNYCPDNCRFITMQEQMSNKRNNIKFTLWNETKNLAEWSRDERCLVTYDILWYRINVGWSPSDAMLIAPREFN